MLTDSMIARGNLNITFRYSLLVPFKCAALAVGWARV
jgi:hypothetical protein